CKNQALHAEEIRSHLDSGMFVSKVAISWKEAVHCIVDDTLAVKRLKFDDKLHEQASDRNPDGKEEQFDADFAIMTLGLKGFINALLGAFGGEDWSREDN